MIIADRSFDSKKELKQCISNYFKKFNDIQEVDLKFFKELLKFHPNYENKCKKMENIFLAKNSWGTKCIHIFNTDGTIDDISYLKCIDGVNNYTNMTKAFRCEIEYQIKNFRKEFLNNSSKCELCNNKLKNDANTHVDHIIKFRDILKKFLQKIKSDFVDTKSIGVRRIIKDEEIRNKWIKYHKKHSKLRLLCKKCNLKLG